MAISDYEDYEGDLEEEFGELGDSLGFSDLEEGFIDDEPEEDSAFGELAEAALDGDEDAEDEFLGILGGLAAKALPALAGSVIPKVLKFGKKLFRRKRRRIVRAAPRIVRKATRIIARRPGVYRRNPARIGMVLNRVTKEYIRRRA